MVSIPFLHRGVFRGLDQRGPVRKPLVFQSPFFIGASSGPDDNKLHIQWVLEFQSPFFIGASSGPLRWQPQCSSRQVSIPFLHQGVFRVIRGYFHEVARGVSIPFLHRGVFREGNSPLLSRGSERFQSPFFIGASSGYNEALTNDSAVWVSIPFLHRGVFRGPMDNYEFIQHICFNPLSSSGRLQGDAWDAVAQTWKCFNPLSSSGRLQGHPVVVEDDDDKFQSLSSSGRLQGSGCSKLTVTT